MSIPRRTRRIPRGGLRYAASPVRSTCRQDTLKTLLSLHRSRSSRLLSQGHFEPGVCWGVTRLFVGVEQPLQPGAPADEARLDRAQIYALQLRNFFIHKTFN